MLAFLKIENLVLVQKAEIFFGPGLNIITGETGSGKSAFLSAIRLLCGERADPQQIRKGASLAIVEASLSFFSPELLAEEGISLPETGQPLRVRREIHLSGKNRCFIEDQQTSLSFLKKCVGSSIERVDQSSSHSLSSSDEQRRLLDIYAQIGDEITSFARAYAEEQAKVAELEGLIQAQMQKEKTLEWANRDLTLIQEIDWKPEEEESLAQEHHRLIHSQELAEKIGSASFLLNEGDLPFLPSLKRCHLSLESCIRFDAKLQPLADALKSAFLELQEVGSSLQSYTDGLETDPRRLSAIEERIAAIEALKRRFGTDQKGIDQLKETLTAQIDKLVRLDDELATKKQELEQIRAKNKTLAEEISGKRKRAAQNFQFDLLFQLKSLNLPHVQLAIDLQERPMASQGIDEIQFLFSANPGLPPLPLDQCASGGELSRLLLAIKTTLSENEKNGCLIFDEIDSNVGGQTAAILGDRLKNLGSSRQVICVTHFVQVARCASHHFLVSKSQENGIASTHISPLIKEVDRQTEYSRMLGKIEN